MQTRVMNEAIERIETLERENLLLRQLLWAWHGCPADASPAGDRDGELRCDGMMSGGHPAIDFRRDHARAIEAALQAPSLDFIHQHQDDRCRYCGVTRWTYEASGPCSGGTHDWITDTHGGN